MLGRDEVVTRHTARKRTAGKAPVGVLIGLTATALTVLVAVITWPTILELFLLDLRHKLFHVPTSHPAIATVAIDDRALEQVGRWPWPRRYLADVVRLCSEAGAAQIALDIGIPEPQETQVLLPGVSDVLPYEPQPEFIGEPQVTVVDNDAQLAAELAAAGNTSALIYAGLSDDPDLQQKGSGADLEALARKVGVFLTENSDDAGEPPSFAAVFAAFYPNGNIHTNDTPRHQLHLAYMRARALRALKRFGFAPEGIVRTPLPYLTGVLPPMTYFAESMADTGYVTGQHDKDSKVRRLALVAQHEGRLYKQLGFACACRALGVADEDIDLSHKDEIILRRPEERGGDVHIPLDRNGNMLVRWTRHWEKDPCNVPITLPMRIAQIEKAVQENAVVLAMIDDLTFKLTGVPDDLSDLDAETRGLVEQMQAQLAALPSAEELRAANVESVEEIATLKKRLRGQLAGKIVFVGSVATGEAAARDFVATPVSKMMPGVMVHRNVVNTILSQNFLTPPPRVLELLATALMGALMTYVAAREKPLFSGLMLTALIAVGAGINFWLMFDTAHIPFAAAMPTVAVLATFMAVTFYRQITEGRDRRRITARFKQYVSPSVVDRIVVAANTVSFAGELREITCYFSDLQGFTTTSERLGPEKTVSVLNIYLDRMTEVLDRFDATINKFEGDGVFAFFGAPVPMENHAKSACLSALAAQEALAELVIEQQALDDNFPDLFMRIGVSTGKAIVGDCGSHRRFDYTAIGDTVNFSARLESANKYFGTKLLIGENTYHMVKDAIDVRPLGKVRVVGKTQGVAVFEMVGPAGSATAEQQEYTELFCKALQAYQESRFPEAAEAFGACAVANPKDKAVGLYLDTIQDVLNEHRLPDLDGCIELTSK